MLRLIERLFSHARRDRAQPALRAAGVAGQTTLSFGDLADHVRSLDAVLPHGATVLLSYPNRPEYVAAFVAVLSAENSLFPVPVDLARPELAAAIHRTRPTAAIVGTELATAFSDHFHSVQPLLQLSADAVLLGNPVAPPGKAVGPALLLQSSGTTGQPKIVVRDGPSLDAVAANMVRACEFRSDDRVLAAVPLCHSYGLEHGILAPLWAGSGVAVCERFDLPAIVRELRHGGITIFPGVPFMFDALCQSESGAFPSLRRPYSAGGPLPRATFDAFKYKFGISIGQVYGATEVGSVTFNDPDRAAFNPGSVGVPMDGVSIRILDRDEPDLARPLPGGAEGQVAIAAPSMMSGYLDEPAPLTGGHFLTGDLGALDDRGALTITGRLKLLIDVGGRKVNPAEVESVLRQHPGVRECVVLPLRLSETVSRLRALVTPSQPDAQLSPQELRRFLRDRLAPHKVPRIFEVRHALPTGPSGKVLRCLAEIS